MTNIKFPKLVVEFCESKTAFLSAIVTLVFVLCAAFAPQLAPTDPFDLTAINLSDALLPVGAEQVIEADHIRIDVSVVDGKAQKIKGKESAEVKLSNKPCGPNCIGLTLTLVGAEIKRLELNGLPRAIKVLKAKKHPILPRWTVYNLSHGVLKMQSEVAIPEFFNFQVVATAKPTPTGFTFWLGTDGFGRDMLSAILYGVRISIFIGLVAAGLAMILGTTLGLIAAWFGGFVDALIMRIVDFMLGFPALLVGLVVLAALGKGVDRIVIAVVVVQWAYYARTVRSVALSELRKEYVEAAKCLRFSAIRILFVHILPNCMTPIIVILTIRIASAISLEASLSFLGVGLPLTEPSLGMLIANGYEYIFSNKYWISIYPGLVLLVMIVAMNLLGDRLRDQFNPRLKK